MGLKTFWIACGALVVKANRPPVVSHSYSSIMNTPIQLRCLSEISTRYEAVFLDQFGVLHDGRSPLSGAVEAVNLLDAQGAKLIVLSNSSKRAADALDKLRSLGFGAVTQALTSGELAWQYLRYHFPGKACCWVTWIDYRRDPFLRGLNIRTCSIAEADFLFVHGSQAIADPAVSLGFCATGVIDEALDRVLRTAVQRDIPVVCANIDFEAILSDGSVGYMPGSIMARYESLGGRRGVSFGKPSEQFFETALDLAYGPALSPLEARRRRLRTLHIGDSLHHDIAGAAACKMDSVLVTRNGVHRHSLHPGEPEEQRLPALLMRVCDEADALGLPRPTYILEELTP
jgi:HAD superfamily hydrolase (TIGR01450 family)